MTTVFLIDWFKRGLLYIPYSLGDTQAISTMYLHTLSNYLLSGPEIPDLVLKIFPIFNCCRQELTDEEIIQNLGVEKGKMDWSLLKIDCNSSNLKGLCRKIASLLKIYIKKHYFIPYQRWFHKWYAAHIHVIVLMQLITFFLCK